jgi:hypothetical protein
MSEDNELESEVEKLKKERIISDLTAEVYLSQARKILQTQTDDLKDSKSQE